MQAQYKERWRRMVNPSSEPVVLGDFGFYDPDGIGDWAEAYINSGFNPGHLPRAGGIRNQTVADRHDLAVYMNGWAWAKAERDDANDEAKILEQFSMGEGAL